MPKMSIELVLIKLEGAVMGTRWKADLGLPATSDIRAIETALAGAVTQVDAQMSTWKPDSDLMRLNAAPVGDWVKIPHDFMQVLARGLEIGRASGGAFDIGLGDLVSAWGFGAENPNEAKIRANLGHKRQPAHEVLELDEANVYARKLAPLALNLSGIAKGFGVDQMIAVCNDFDIPSALMSLDGELRSKGVQPNGTPWTVAIEKPAYEARLPLSMLELQDIAVATSGDYRHWIDAGEARLSHTMDRNMGGPVQPGIASVTVLAADCMTADAMATAILVSGIKDGIALARKASLDCLILERVGGNGILPHGTGAISQFGFEDSLFKA
jgi:FAD:protein FMN transferase